MPATTQQAIERRVSSPQDWLDGVCSEFTAATGWDLKFAPGDRDTQTGFDRRELDWCWHSSIHDGRSRLGAFLLDVPLRSHPDLPFESACRLAELIASQCNHILQGQSRLDFQSDEIVALVAPMQAGGDFRRRLQALLRASVNLPRFLSAALFVLAPDGRSLLLRLTHRIAPAEVPVKRRPLSQAEHDLAAIESGPQIVTAGSVSDSLFLPDGMAIGLCVPVQNASGPIGTMWLFDRRSHQPAQSELQLLEGFGQQMADVFERVVLLKDSDARTKLRRELDVVASSTSALNDVSADFPGCEVSVRSRSRCEVGGDLCEAIDIDDYRTAIIIGDASGDSIPAAIVMTATRGALHALLDDGPQVQGLDHIVSTVNRAVQRVTAAQQFISLVIGIYDSRTHTFEYTNAGHPPPLLVRDRTIRSLESQGLLLGVVDSATYSTATIEVARDDLLIMFSDGITEARSSSQQMFRNDGIVAAVDGCAGMSSREVLETIWRRYENHTEGRNLDDRTLLVVRFTG